MKLFNQVLAIGFGATLFQILCVWPFIQSQGLIFLIMNAGIIGAFYLNHIGLSWHSKRVFQLLTYGMGASTTVLLGGSGYYHLQAFLIFYLGLIMFDFRKEKIEVLIGIPFIAFSIIVGELGLLGAPDFSGHELTPIIRFANLFSLFSISIIFTSFLIRVNTKSEAELKRQSAELARGNSRLEEAVRNRTAEIEQQKNVLERQNAEKELLLKEVHHRVKNNLQIIVSLINLQLQKFDNTEVEEALRETQNRVHSMSLVHKKMYQSTNFTEIGLNDYVTQIIDNIGDLYGEENFQFNVNIPPEIKIDVEKAIPMGLIINEIVTNFFKHAYCDSCQVFEIDAELNADDRLELNYKDEGKGFDSLMIEEDVNSLGLQLIDSLVQQLDGELNILNDNGAVYKVVVDYSRQSTFEIP